MNEKRPDAWLRFHRNKWRYFTIILSLIVTVGLAYLTKNKHSGTEVNIISDITATLLLNSASTLIGFFFAFLVVSGERRQELLESLQEALSPATNSLGSIKSSLNRLEARLDSKALLKDVDWPSLISQSNRIDFLVQGWDGWMDDHREELTDFFNRNGEFKLYVVDPDDPDAKLTRELMEVRLSKSPSQVVNEITGTISTLQKAYNDAKERQKKEPIIVKLKQINWYFAARIASNTDSRPDVLILSFYSHFSNPVKNMPTMILSSDSHEAVFKWFVKELESLEANNTHGKKI